MRIRLLPLGAIQGQECRINQLQESIMAVFGWWIESGEMRWFTRDKSRVRHFRGMRGVVVTALAPCDDSAVEAQVADPISPVPECEHEPDVMKRCRKCGVNLDPFSPTKGS